jgi:CheY-like chemotaxis protein
MQTPTNRLLIAMHFPDLPSQLTKQGLRYAKRIAPPAGPISVAASYPMALLDLLMPAMDGFELARAIKSDPKLAAMHYRRQYRESKGSRTAGSGDREKSIAAGMDDHITKPVKQEELAECLRSSSPVPEKRFQRLMKLHMNSRHPWIWNDFTRL